MDDGEREESYSGVLAFVLDCVCVCVMQDLPSVDKLKRWLN